MRTLTLIAIALTFAAGMARADRPAVVAVSSMTGVTVKLTDGAGYTPGSSLSYEIRHLPDGESLATGTIKAEAIQADSWGLSSFNVEGLKPKLWWPQDPQLYEVSVSDSTGHLLGRTRFGFRTFVAKGDKFLLNGRPIFLRSVPINPPGRELLPATEHDPQFIRGYIKLMKSANVNMIRTDSQDWLDACDELGMMVFTGRYGPAPGGSGAKPPTVDEAKPYYRDLTLGLASHPSILIYILTNEVDYKSPGSTYKEFLTAIREDIASVDSTRPVIGNAGFGHGQPGEVYDIHPYTGWYFGNINDWYGTYATSLAQSQKAKQPLTLSECVAAYTSDDGNFETMSKQLCNMTKYVGAAEDPRKAALEYQAELVKQVVEIGRQQRKGGSGVAGTMPFTYFLGWSNAKTAEDMIVKPAFEMLKLVYQPILISPQCWHRDLYEGDELKLQLCVANDDDSGRDLAPSKATVEVLAADGHLIASGTADFPAIPYYSNAWAKASIPVPMGLPKGYYDVRCKLVENGVEVSHNSFGISIEPWAWVKGPSASVALFDSNGDTARALKLLGVKFDLVTDLREMPKKGVLVIGEGSLAKDSYPSKSALLSFLDKGGRVLCLRQDVENWSSRWLPASFTMQNRSYTYIQPVGGNAAIFDGITDRDLRYWNELGRLSSTTPDVYPVIGAFKPKSLADLRSVRVWASCDQLLGNAAMMEISHGSGSITLSQFRLVDRIDTDPIATKLLANLISYVASGKIVGPIDLIQPVKWDLSAFGSGAFASPVQGFLPHSRTYEHKGNSKGMLGADHRIDGFTLVGDYGFNGNGWLTPVPDPNADGWGLLYGRLSRPATRFVVKLHNTNDKPAKIALKLDGKAVGSAQILEPDSEKSMEWSLSRAAGPVEVELRGDQKLVITESRFE